MIQQLSGIITKNIILLARNKVSSFVIILGPIIFILLVGTALNTSGVSGLRIGIVPGESKEFVDSLNERFLQSEISVDIFSNNNTCIKAVFEEVIHSCIILPSNISEDNRISFYVDYSRLNLVSSLVNIMTTGVSAEGRDISLDLTSELLNQISNSRSSISSQKSVLTNAENQIDKLEDIFIELSDRLDSINQTSELDSAIKGMEQSTGSSQSALSQFSNDLDNSLDSSKTSISLIEADLVDAKAELIVKIDSANSTLTTIAEAKISLLCPGGEGSLVPYLGDPDAMALAILSADRPNCVHLNTYDELIQGEKDAAEASLAQTNSILNDISGLLADIDSLSAQNADFSSTTDTGLAGLNTNIEDLKEINSEFSEFLLGAQTNIGSAETTIGQSDASIKEIKTSIDDIEKTLSSLELEDPEKIVTPFTSRIEAIASVRKSLEFVFPSMVVLVTMFVGLLLASSVTLKEKQSRSFFRNSITPVPDWMFFIASAMTTFVIVLIQIIILFIIGKFLFQISLNVSPLLLLFSLSLVFAEFTVIGLIIGNLFKSEELTTITAVFSSILMLMFSNIVVPIERMREILRAVVQYNPFFISENLLRKILILNQGIGDVSSLVSVLVFQTLVFSIAAFILFKVGKKSAKLERN